MINDSIVHEMHFKNERHFLFLLSKLGLCARAIYGRVTV